MRFGLEYINLDGSTKGDACKRLFDLTAVVAGTEAKEALGERVRFALKTFHSRWRLR